MIRDHPIRGEDQGDFVGESEGSPPPLRQDSLPEADEARTDFWSISGNIIYRHHVEPRVKLYSQRKESFSVPLKYIDVSRTTKTNLDVKQERRIDGNWNFDGSRDLSDSWTGFTQFTLRSEKPPEGHMWSGERLTKRQATSRPDHFWPELWRGLTRNARWREKHRWTIDKPKLDNATRLRGIYFIVRTWSSRKPKKCKEKIGYANGSSYALQDLQEKQALEKPHSKTNDFKPKFACILEASESTTMRLEESLPEYHEDHIAGKGDNSLQHYNFVHEFIPMHQAMKIQAAKSRSC